MISGSRSLCLAACPRRTANRPTQPYDGDAFRAFLIGRKTVPVICPNPTRKRIPALDEARYKQRNFVEHCFSHLKDFRRVTTRYDKLARNFVASVVLAAILICWT